YVPFSWPADMGSRSEASITQQIVRDITVGVGETGVRSGIIGEIGNYWPMDDTQAKVLRASARAQVETGAAILIHPGLDTLSPPQILDTLTKAGANHGRIIIGHMDHFEDVGMFREIVRRGSYIEWDIFGYEDTSWTGLGRQTKMTRWATDVERMEWIEVLIAEGFGKQIVIAHDECLKIHRKQYGGKGYGHIMENIVPRMRKRGFTEEHINDILVENPKRILTFE
ncbi:MAG: hypothetical protein FJ317_08105, partial [SAR202 cluster bacterium]|nr:hypothetical protein [SAR202 cluster bacterium]